MQEKYWIRQHRFELLIMAIIPLFISASMYLQIYGFRIEFTDTDDYMRVVRIRDFFESFDWSNNVIKRCNVPFGCSLHWTRFYDFFLIIPSYFLSFFTDSINTAIDYVCFCIGPLIRITTAFVFLRILQKFFSPENAFLGCILFIVNPIIAINGIFGRPDHHSFILLFVIVFLYKFVLASESNFSKHYISTARLSAICIWISPETLIPLLLLDAILCLYSFTQRKNSQKHIFRFLYMKNMGIALYIGLILLGANQFTKNFSFAAVLVSILGFVFYINKARKNDHSDEDYNKYAYLIFLMWLIVGLHNISPMYYDEISIVHFTLYICVASFFNIFTYTIHKNFYTDILFFGLLIAGIFLSKYPDFIYGMSANISPYAKKVWLSKVGEMRSPIATGNEAFYVMHFFFVVLAAFCKCCEIFRGTYKKQPYAIIFWGFTIVTALIYLIFAGLANRMLLYSFTFSLPLLVDFGMNGFWREKFNRFTKIVITFFMTTLFIFVAALIDGEDEDSTGNNAKNKYSTRELFTVVDNLSKIPVVIMAHSNDGPMILYYTKHSAVGAPYHRQEQGIISSYEVMENAYSEQKIKNVLRETGAAYIFVRKSQLSKDKGQGPNLSEMIINGNYPNWLQPVKLPAKFSDIAIAKVRKEVLTKQ